MADRDLTDTPARRVAGQLHSVRKAIENTPAAAVVVADYVADIVRIPALAGAIAGTVAESIHDNEEERGLLEIFGGQYQGALDKFESAEGEPGVVGGGIAPALGKFSKFSREAAQEARDKMGVGPPTFAEIIASLFLPGVPGSIGTRGAGVAKAASREGGGGASLIDEVTKLLNKVKQEQPNVQDPQSLAERITNLRLARRSSTRVGGGGKIEPTEGGPERLAQDVLDDELELMLRGGELDVAPTRQTQVDEAFPRELNPPEPAELLNRRAAGEADEAADQGRAARREELAAAERDELGTDAAGRPIGSRSEAQRHLGELENSLDNGEAADAAARLSDMTGSELDAMAQELTRSGNLRPGFDSEIADMIQTESLTRNQSGLTGADNFRDVNDLRAIQRSDTIIEDLLHMEPGAQPEGRTAYLATITDASLRRAINRLEDPTVYPPSSFDDIGYSDIVHIIEEELATRVRAGTAGTRAQRENANLQALSEARPAVSVVNMTNDELSAAVTEAIAASRARFVADPAGESIRVMQESLSSGTTDAARASNVRIVRQQLRNEPTDTLERVVERLETMGDFGEGDSRLVAQQRDLVERELTRRRNPRAIVEDE